MYAQPLAEDFFIIPSRVGNILSRTVAGESSDQVVFSTILSVGAYDTNDSIIMCDVL